MRVWDHIRTELDHTRLHFTLIDPDHHPSHDTGAMAQAAAAAGTNAFMVGGSTGVTSEKLGATVDAIKKESELPVILFPSQGRAITPNLDAVFFMAVMNSTNIRFLTSEQLIGTFAIRKYQLEAIPMGYIIVEPGMKVGEVSEADVVHRSDYQRAVGYALMTQYYGMRLVYFEAGSGAPAPVPTKMVEQIRSQLDIPLIIGGGIRTPDDARAIGAAGADIIVTGTILEEVSEPQKIETTLGYIIDAFKRAARAKQTLIAQ